MPLQARAILTINRVLSIAALSLLLSANVFAQQARVRITVLTNKTLQIEIHQRGATDSWSFLNAISGTLGLGERISNFKASNSGHDVAATRIASGEFRSHASRTRKFPSGGE